MKIIILYYSQSGNTREVAKVMYDELSYENDVSIVNIVDYNPSLLNEFDLVFIGSPCHSSDLAPQVKAFLSNLSMDSTYKLAGFYTHSTKYRDGTEKNNKYFDEWAGACSRSFEQVAKEKNIDLVGLFNCRGKATKPIEQFILEHVIKLETDQDEFMKELREHPTTSEFKKARNFAHNTVKKINKGA